jgi:hypothetical protein
VSGGDRRFMVIGRCRASFGGGTRGTRTASDDSFPGQQLLFLSFSCCVVIVFFLTV